MLDSAHIGHKLGEDIAPPLPYSCCPIHSTYAHISGIIFQAEDDSVKVHQSGLRGVLFAPTVFSCLTSTFTFRQNLVFYIYLGQLG